MRLSQRMARLGHGDRVRGPGARARARGAGPQRRPPRDRRARLRHARPHHRGRRSRALASGRHALRPVGRACPSCARRSPRTRRAGAACSATPEMVVVTPGGKPIMFFVILALVDEGDEVLYPNPGFPIYESMIRYIGGKPVPVRLLEEKGFALDVDQLCEQGRPEDAAHHPQLPAQPDRRDHPRERAARDRGRRRPSTACPSSPTRSTRASSTTASTRSIAAMPGMEPLAIVLDGFSKTYAMTGWRLGYGIMPAPMAQVVAKLQTNATSCTATFTQLAAVEALRGDQSSVDAHGGGVPAAPRRDRGRPARDPRLHLRAAARAPSTSSRTSRGTGLLEPQALADRLLDEAGVACLSRHRLRRVRRGPPALLVREQHGEHPGGAAPDREPAEEVVGAAPCSGTRQEENAWPTWTR